MLSVLIVDDEEPVLDAFSFLLNEGIPGFRLAGVARDGYEAIKAMYEFKPDVVFMDINMPGLDGLDTIAEVHDKFPDTNFVLATAYERFDLARRAIPLGVFAYLVKPITRQDFRGTLAAIAAARAKRRPAAAAGRDESLVKAFLSDAVWRDLEPEVWRDWRDKLGLESDRGSVAFLLLDADPAEGGSPYAAVNRRLERRHRFLFAVHLHLGMYYFPGDADPVALAAALAAAVADAGLPEGSALAAAGAPRSGGELHVSCAEALAELNRRRDRADLRLRERLLIGQLRRKLGLSELEETRGLFAAYWEDCFAAYGFELAKAKQTALFALLLDDCTACYQSQGGSAPPFDPAEEISALADLAAWRDWSLPAFNQVYNLARHRRTGLFPAPLVKALAFVESNYERPIQLPDAAEAAGVSAAYLSRLFGAHLGGSFVDHLTLLRVERAERLLRERGLSVKEAAAAVGYADPNYFSKIFRKLVGSSPSRYARRDEDAS
jgi:two-component system response regulator YesN